MLFSSLTFLYFFLPIVLILYFVINNRTWHNAVLLVSSLVFYSWGEPKYVFLMLASTLVAWLCGLGIDRFKEKRRISRAFLIASLVLLLGSLAVFKYLNFFVENLNRIDGVALKVRNIALPIGISFYTFQILSYLIDLYWEKVSVQKSYFRFTLYVCLFPQLIAGPIVRYETVEREISLRRESWEEAVGGMRRFILGLAKKVLIANNVAAVAEYIYSSSSAGSGAYWLAAVCYTLQIYFDFSGYSDMAIGLGRIFGFHFLENFNYPYISRSVTEFWRRWHISLSSWFRDYVYIPLGGNRVKTSRWILNILIVWALTGFWHGAQWNFILWGLYYAVLLLCEKLLWGEALKKLPSAVQWIYTMLLVIIGWVLFDKTDFAQLGHVIGVMFSFVPTGWTTLLAERLQAAFEANGYHALFGKTQGYYGPYVWRETVPTVYRVELPDGTAEYTVNILKGFVFRSWMDYLTFGRYGTGGWASPDGTISCVEQAYDFESERFLVSLLKHEAQHAMDMKRFPKITPAELEYRAKLVELHYSGDLGLLQKFLSETDESRTGDSHAAASARIRREFAGTDQANLPSIQARARELLHAHTKELEVKYGH